MRDDDPSELRPASDPHDAISLLEARDKEDLEALVVSLGGRKTGNKQMLALRVGEHAKHEEIRKHFYRRGGVGKVREYLNTLGETTEGDVYECAERLCKALRDCYSKRMKVKDIPWNLKDKTRLTASSYDIETLKRLCEQRNIKIRPSQKRKTLANYLAKWRKALKKGPAKLEEYLARQAAAAAAAAEDGKEEDRVGKGEGEDEDEGEDEGGEEDEERRRRGL